MTNYEINYYDIIFDERDINFNIKDILMLNKLDISAVKQAEYKISWIRNTIRIILKMITKIRGKVFILMGD